MAGRATPSALTVSGRSKGIAQHSWVRAVALFVLACASGLAFRVVLPEGLGADSTDYHTYYAPVAANLVAGRGLVDRDGAPAIAQPPGYPLILAALQWLAARGGGEPEALVPAFNILMLACSTVLLYLISAQIWGGWPALIPPLLWLTYPYILWLTKHPSSEMPFVAALYGAYAVLAQVLQSKPAAARLAFGAGLLAGAATLIRSIAVGLGGVLALTVLFAQPAWPARRRLICASLILAGQLAMLLPWQAWVFSKTQRGVLLNTGAAPSMRDGLTFAVESKGYRLPIALPPSVLELMRQLAAQAARGKLATPGAIALVIGQHFWSNPRAVVQLFAIKAMRSWYATDSGRLESVNLAVQGIYLALLAVSSFAAWRRRVMGHRWGIAISLGVLYFWVMTILVLSILRYTTPIMGLMFLVVPALAAPHQLVGATTRLMRTA